MPRAATIFQANCAVCHGAKGLGQPSLAPPLTSYPARYASIAEGRRQLAMTVLNGMFGGIDVESKHYDFKMPEFSQLDDAALAAALNFVVFDLGHAAEGTKPLAAGGNRGRTRAPPGRRGRARTPHESARRARALTMSRGGAGAYPNFSWLSRWPAAASAQRAQIPRRTTCSSAWAATASKPKECPARSRLWPIPSAASCAAAPAATTCCACPAPRTPRCRMRNWRRC